MPDLKTYITYKTVNKTAYTMKKTPLLWLFSIFFLLCNTLYGQQDSAIAEMDRDEAIRHYLNNFNELHIGHYGTTQNCVAYDVYAFKYRWHWFLFIKTGDKLSFMAVRPPLKGKKIDYPSKFLIEGIAMSHFHKYTKFVKRKRNVVDMNIYGYYKFNRFGRRIIRNLMLLEYPYYNKGFWRWQLNEEKTQKKAEKEAAKEAAKSLKIKELESIKPNINETVPIEKK